MKTLDEKTKKRIKIFGAVTVTVFSLVSVITGTYAWFAANRKASVENSGISVIATGSADLKKLELIKFDYDYDVIEDMKIYDYLNPATGNVNRYCYNGDYDSGAGAFGYYDGDTFIPVDAIMNLYDPVDRIIRGGDLIGLNCNAIYAATFTSDMPVSYLRLIADRLTNKKARNNEILLSECADMDVYFDSDLEFCEDSYSPSSTYDVDDFTLYGGILYRCINEVSSAESFNPSKWQQILYYSSTSTYPVNSCVFYSGAIYTNVTAINNHEAFSKAKWQQVENYSSTSLYDVDDFIIHNGRPYKCITAIESGETFNANKWEAQLCHDIYYPSYKGSGYTAEDEIYYKFSYISSLEPSHSNFYSTKPKPKYISLLNERTVEFANPSDEQVIYINVNYSPSQADAYTKAIYNNIRAIYDFIFNFQFTVFKEEIGA